MSTLLLCVGFRNTLIICMFSKKRSLKSPLFCYIDFSFTCFCNKFAVDYYTEAHKSVKT